MAFIDFFSSKQNEVKKFVDENRYRTNQVNQVKMAPETLKQLRDLGVTETNELKLEYFFYTNTLEKSKIFADEIQKLNYSAKYGKSAGDKKLFIITGWTIKMPMSDFVVKEWVKKMCEIGYKYDCDFDGWGTEPDQK